MTSHTNAVLIGSLAIMLCILVLAAVDPLVGQSTLLSARVIKSDSHSSTLALPDGRITVIDIGNLVTGSMVKLCSQQHLISGSDSFRLKQTES